MYSPKHNCASDVHARAIKARTFTPLQPFSSRRRADCVPCISPAHACLHTRRSTIPQVHMGFHPPSRCWRSGCSGASRRCTRAPAHALVLCTFYLHGHRPAPSRLWPSADFASHLLLLSDSPVRRSHPVPSDQSGAGLIPADRRQQPQSQLLLPSTSGSTHASAGARRARAHPGVPGRSSAAGRRRAGRSVPIPERTKPVDIFHPPSLIFSIL